MWSKNLGARLNQPFKLKTRSLSGGEKGNVETVDFMRDKARKLGDHPRIREEAIHILASATPSLDSHDEKGEALAIGEWVQKNVRYVKDPNGTEYLMSPLTLIDQVTIGKGMGDCDDMSLLIATLLLSIGHSPKFRTVRYEGQSGAYDHIYVVDYVRNLQKKKERVVLDAIIKDQPMGFEIWHASAAEFDI